MHLGCAALSLRSIFDSPEIATVQAVALMAAFHGVGGRKYTMDSCWSLISLASKLAQSVCRSTLSLSLLSDKHFDAASSLDFVGLFFCLAVSKVLLICICRP